MREFLKEQLEGFKKNQKDIIGDMNDIIKETDYKKFFVNTVCLYFIAVLYFVNLGLYIGSIILVAVQLGFKYLKEKLGSLQWPLKRNQ